MPFGEHSVVLAVSGGADSCALALGVADVHDYVWIYDLERKEGRKLATGVVPK